MMKYCNSNIDIQRIWNFVLILVHLMHVVLSLIKQLGLNLAI
jgi:hypothetical protein